MLVVSPIKNYIRYRKGQPLCWNIKSCCISFCLLNCGFTNVHIKDVAKAFFLFLLPSTHHSPPHSLPSSSTSLVVSVTSIRIHPTDSVQIRSDLEDQAQERRNLESGCFISKFKVAAPCTPPPSAPIIRKLYNRYPFVKLDQKRILR